MFESTSRKALKDTQIDFPSGLRALELGEICYLTVLAV